MATDLENIQTIKSNTLTALAEISANPKPTYDIDGQEILHNEYRKQLQDTINWCNEQLKYEEGPEEEETLAIDG